MSQEKKPEKKYKLQPAPGRIAVQTSKISEEISEGGIILGSYGNQIPTVGKVIANCAEYEQDGENFDPLYSIGDIVVFGKYTGTAITVGRETILLLRESDILCRLSESEDEDAVAVRRVKISERHTNEN